MDDVDLSMELKVRELKKGSSPMPRDGIQLHIEQTQTQIERVEQAMEKLEVPRSARSAT